MKIKKELESTERNIKDFIEKKGYLLNCLKNFYLRVLKDEQFFYLLDYDLSEILIALWKLKYKVEGCDLPNLLDLESKNYLIENAKITWNYQKAKKKLRVLNKMERFDHKKECNKGKNEGSCELQKSLDKNGLLKILSFKKSLKKFEINLDNAAKAILKVFFFFLI